MFKYHLTIVCLACFVLAGCGTLGPSKPLTKWRTDLDRFSTWSDGAICDSATFRGKWETRKYYLPHVKEAKRRGLTCDVAVNTRELCKITPAQCSTIELCDFATKGAGSTKAWDTRYPRHVTLAKQKNYTCGVSTAAKEDCKSTPAQCSTTELCNFATKGAGSAKAWDTRYPRHVNEAKRRGFTCSVQTRSGSSSAATSYDNDVPDILKKAIDRLKRIGKLNANDSQLLVQKLKRMEPNKLRELNSKCTKAFENLQPSLCEDQLTKLVR